MSVLYEFFLWNISLWGGYWYWIVAIVGFWLQLRFEQVINGGGGSTREFLSALQEGFMWAIPGSKKRRGAYIRQMLLDGGDHAIGSIEGYSYEEIRRHDLYEEVGLKMLPGPFWFWSRVVGWVFWPAASATFLLIALVSWIIHGILVLFLGGVRTQAIYEKIFS